MKTTHFSKKTITAIVSSLMAAMLCLLILAAAPTAPVFAETGPTPAPHARKTPGQNNARLTLHYQNEQQVLIKQQSHLDKVNQLAAKIQTLIDKARGAGKDVSALESALANFNSKVASAKSAHDQAASILGTHNGFDASGSVTDAAAAHQTLVDARLALRDVHSNLSQAAVELRQAVRTWRQQNLPANKK